MKAAVFLKPNELVLKDVEIPELKEGEALVKVIYSGICGTDVHVYHGKHKTATFPVTPGHEFVGEVVSVNGDGADQFHKGDHVVVQPYFSCGRCDACAQGYDNICVALCFMGVHTDGSFAQFVKVPTKKMYKIPMDMDMKLGALIEPIAVAVHDVRRSGLKAGETALIIGGGPIGLLIALVARHSGANKVIISEISEYRRKFAKNLGFETLNPLESDFDGMLKKISEGKGFDVVFEVSGAKPSIKTALEQAKVAGTVMIVGMTSEAYPVELFNIFAKELTIKGVRIHSQYNFIGAIELLKNGALNEAFASLISKEFSLSEINSAFEYAESNNEFFKILVNTSL